MNKYILVKYLAIILGIVAVAQHNPVILANITALALVGVQYAVKMILLWKFHRKLFCSIRTHLNKMAVSLQMVFFIHSQFFLPSQVMFLLAVAVTGGAIGEEIILIITRKDLNQNFKGMFFKS